MKRSRSNRIFVLLLGLVLARWVTGCATNEERLSEQPWNAPKSWENGLPGAMMDERR